jgi:hypothetical protein
MGWVVMFVVIILLRKHVQQLASDMELMVRQFGQTHSLVPLMFRCILPTSSGANSEQGTHNSFGGFDIPGDEI